MANCAHKAARGYTQTDIAQMDPGSRPATATPLLSLANLMNYVQNESKVVWHSGIAYTMMMLQTIDFLRPKLFSSTRMCLYEYDQMKRFLEICHYFDVPWHFEVISRLMLPVLFAERIILKTVQKTDDQREYVDRVILGLNLPEPEGKTAMQLCLRVANDVIRGNQINYLDNIYITY